MVNFQRRDVHDFAGRPMWMAPKEIITVFAFVVIVIVIVYYEEVSFKLLWMYLFNIPEP